MTKGTPASSQIIWLEGRVQELESKLAKWETALTAVMPADYKDWHENSKAEWPELAASSITDLRARLAEACELAERFEAQVAALTAENENVRRANIDCVDHFNAVKADYDAKCIEAEELRQHPNAALFLAKLEAEHNRYLEKVQWMRDKVTGDQMVSAIAVLLNVATFGSTPLYEDGTETPNRLLQLKAAKFLHSLHSNTAFEDEHKWLLDQIGMHPRYAAMAQKGTT